MTECNYQHIADDLYEFYCSQRNTKEHTIEPESFYEKCIQAVMVFDVSVKDKCWPLFLELLVRNMES